LVDTGARRELAAGAFNERRSECERALARLKLDLPELVWLASWPAAWLPRLKRALPEPLRSRALHVIGETARARFGAQLLARGQLKRFGELLYQSHESCRRLYDCSTPELDTVVAAARGAGALGARLTGAGWGGAVLVLLAKAAGKSGKHEAKVVREIQQAFRAAYGRDPAINRVHPSGGVGRLHAADGGGLNPPRRLDDGRQDHPALNPRLFQESGIDRGRGGQQCRPLLHQRLRIHFIPAHHNVAGPAAIDATTGVILGIEALLEVHRRHVGRNLRRYGDGLKPLERV